MQKEFYLEIFKMSKKKLDIEVGTKEEAIWNNVLREANMLIKSSEDSLIIQKAMKELAETKIREEKAK